MSTDHTPRTERAPDTDAPEVIMFDRFARSAGASLRSEAPEDGMRAVVRQGKRERTRRLAIEVGIVVAFVLGGVAVLRRSDDNGPNVNNPPVPTTKTAVSPVPTSTGTVPESTMSADDPRINQWFLDYTGNPAGPVSGEPVKFGIVMPSFLYRHALDAAATYINEQAGGVGGRPIVLDVCSLTPTECAEQFAGDPAIVAVLENEWSNDSLGTALAGRKPLHTTYSGSGTTGVGYYPTYRETITAMAPQAEKLTAPGAQVLVIDAAMDQEDMGDELWRAFVAPDLSASLANRNLTVIKASPSEQLVDTMRAAGATHPDAIILASPPLADALVDPFGRAPCDDLSDAVDELGIRPAVIVVDCSPHEGWYVLDVGFNQTSPSLQSGALPITTKLPSMGDTKNTPGVRGFREVGALLAVIRLINQVGGPAQATPTALATAMRDFTGPLPLGAGLLDCSPTGRVAQRVQPGSCVRFVDVHQFVNDTWIDLEPIDLGA
ncbi:MAG: hypothetical protein ACXV6M_08600 [Ilumatobacteraceae bacterium]